MKLRLQRVLVWGPHLCGVAELGLHQRQVERPPHIDVRWERAGPLQKPEELVGLGDDVMDVGVPREGASDGDSEIKVYAIKVVTVTKGLIVSLHHQPQHVGPAHSGSSSTNLKIDQRHCMPSVWREGCCCQRSQKS